MPDALSVSLGRGKIATNYHFGDVLLTGSCWPGTAR